ncbi:hypothetical protein MOQ_007101 [Trypanosoma cruzi marinkellei]|uniref:Uncharacterized protein n=1 Tax=Trypanosoma cruzi marinkellei TaxID=85056 RepID=K2N3G0_TRYCR|nr:hypothetical protein MOQ_007101 [Trypanosoma cruzi marinkellei]
MSVDPLIPASEERQELERLLKENRKLREDNALLRISAEAKRTSDNNGKAKNVTATAEEVKDNTGPSEESVDGNASSKRANVKRLKEDLQHCREELERALREQKEAKEECKQLKSIFESFVVESCEREEACKLIFARVYEEIEEQKKLCEGLQRQLQERPPAVVAPLVATPAAAVVGMDPSSLYDIVDNLRFSLSELEHRLGYNGDAGSRQTAPAAGAAASRVGRGKARSAVGVGTTVRGDTYSKTQEVPGHHHSQEAESAVRLVVPAKGAGALRATGVLGSQSTTTERKKRGRKKQNEIETVKRHAGELSSEVTAASLFKSITPVIAKPKGPVVNFGQEPIADYLGLLEKTDLGNVDVLRRELMNFCGSDVNTLASYAVEHFFSKSLLKAPVITLWKHTERVMHIGKDVFSAFMKQAVRKLVRLLGPECAAEIDHTPQLRCLALVVRMACAISLRDSAQGGDAFFVAFYECTVSALRSWRIGSSAGEQRHVLGPWMVVAQHLCGFVEEFHEVVRYYANSERVLDALTIPNSLTRYAVQAIMASCYFNSSPQSPVEHLGSDAHADMEMWINFCDAMDWSRNELPLKLIGSAAAKILAHSKDVIKRGEALLSLRLLVLQKGLGLLQTLTEELRVSGGEVDIDAAFAELFSLAVIDLQLEDPRDEQWGRAMAFFAEYLSANSVEQSKSNEELLAACKGTHVLVLRAMLQLCNGAGGAIPEESAEQLAKALQWAKALHVGLERSTRETKASVLVHPFQSTLLGQQLRYLCSQKL